MTIALDNGKIANLPPEDTDRDPIATEERRSHVKVTLSGRLIDMVYRLRDYYGLTSLAATVSRAVALMDQIAELEESGGELIYRRPDGREQVLKIIMT